MGIDSWIKSQASLKNTFQFLTTNRTQFAGMMSYRQRITVILTIIKQKVKAAALPEVLTFFIEFTLDYKQVYSKHLRVLIMRMRIQRVNICRS